MGMLLLAKIPKAFCITLRALLDISCDLVRNCLVSDLLMHCYCFSKRVCHWVIEHNEQDRIDMNSVNGYSHSMNLCTI